MFIFACVPFVDDADECRVFATNRKGLFIRFLVCLKRWSAFVGASVYLQLDVLSMRICVCICV